jgi:hypothetical protein
MMWACLSVFMQHVNSGATSSSAHVNTTSGATSPDVTSTNSSTKTTSSDAPTPANISTNTTSGSHSAVENVTVTSVHLVFSHHLDVRAQPLGITSLASGVSGGLKEKDFAHTLLHSGRGMRFALKWLLKGSFAPAHSSNLLAVTESNCQTYIAVKKYHCQTAHYDTGRLH